jgi:hypothetical protein
MKKIHNKHYPAGLEWVILKMLPKILIGGVFIPLFMSIFIRLFPVDATAAEIAKHQISIDILSISLFFTMLTAVFTVAIGCIIVVLMKGPAYVADAYDLEDADHPESENKNIDKNKSGLRD